MSSTASKSCKLINIACSAAVPLDFITDGYSKTGMMLLSGQSF